MQFNAEKRQNKLWKQVTLITIYCPIHDKALIILPQFATDMTRHNSGAGSIRIILPSVKIYQYLASWKIWFCTFAADQKWLITELCISVSGVILKPDYIFLPSEKISLLMYLQCQELIPWDSPWVRFRYLFLDITPSSQGCQMQSKI